MRQVPHYLLIGRGRVAQHFTHYFSLLSLSFSTWNQQESKEKLSKQVSEASHILLLISDHAIDDFIREHLLTSNALLIHFSGSLISQYAHGVHPLMTFNQHRYTLDQYQAFPFVVDQDAPAFDVLLPGLPNKHARLEKSQKAKYHALCVLTGFSCLLWQKLFHDFETELNIPASIAHPYLQQQTHNLLVDYALAFTGPLVRNDIETINKNLAALHNDVFQDVYQSVVACYQKMTEENTL